MRLRKGSSLVAALAVLAVAGAAVWDAVRPGPSESVDAAAAAQLADLGATGTLIYTDRGCAIHALTLPELEPTSVPEGLDAACEISVSPNGSWVAPAGARWSPQSTRYATCQGARVSVFAAQGGAPREVHTGCAPAWHPDGTLTLVRDGIRDTQGRVLIPQSVLERTALHHPNAPQGAEILELRVLDLAWLDRAELAVLIDARYLFGLPGRETIVAGFRGGRRVWSEPHFGLFERLVVSDADDVLLEPAEPQVFASPYRLTPTGPVDWSPDGLRIAVATRASVYVVDPRTARRVRIPITVRDLAWR